MWCPALAIARALVDRGHAPSSIRLRRRRSGASRRALVPDAGFPLTLLPGRGIAASAVAGRTWSRRPRSSIAVLRGIVLLVRRRPKVVVSVGGYASVPAGIAAAVTRVPIVVARAERRTRGGQPARGRFGQGQRRHLPGTPLPRAVVTGSPMRPEILAVDRQAPGAPAARAALGLPSDAGDPGDRRLAGCSTHQRCRRRCCASCGPTDPTSPSTTSSAGATGRTSRPATRPQAGGCTIRAGGVRGPHGDGAGRRGRRRRPPGGRRWPSWPSPVFPAVLVPLPDRDRGPSDCQRRARSSRPAARCSSPTASSTTEPPGRRARGAGRRPRPTPRRWQRRSARFAVTDAADRVAELVESHARG